MASIEHLMQGLTFIAQRPDTSSLIEFTEVDATVKRFADAPPMAGNEFYSTQAVTLAGPSPSALR